VGHVGSVPTSAEWLQKIWLLFSSAKKHQASLGLPADRTSPAEAFRKE